MNKSSMRNCLSRPHELHIQRWSSHLKVTDSRGVALVFPYDCWPRSPAQRSAHLVRVPQRHLHQGFITVHGRAGGGADETISTSRLFEHCYATADTPSTDGMSVS